MLLFYILHIVLIKSTLVHSELFTSTTHLTHLLDTEVELSKQLESYLQEEYERIDRIEKYFSLMLNKLTNSFLFSKRFLNIIKDEIRQAQGNEENYFGNPVNAHLFVKHLTADWYNIEEIVSNSKFMTY